MKKSTIALIVAAVVCLGLSAFSAKASVTRTNEAIEEIGEVTYSEDCKAKIDRAVEYYNALDKNLDLQEKVNKEDMKNFLRPLHRLFPSASANSPAKTAGSDTLSRTG